MSKKIRALILEDTEDDKELLLMHLKKGGLDVEYQCVQTEESFNESLDQNDWDIILSDYSMPDFDGLKALQITKDTGRDIPFILISGAIGEELAVEVMRSGAADYFIKGNLHRLVPSIEKELKDVKRRRRFKSVETHRRRLLKVVQQSLNEIYIFSSETLKFEYANENALKNIGYTLREIKQITPVDIKSEFTIKSFHDLLEPLRNAKTDKIILKTHHKRKDHSSYPVEVHIQLINEQNQSFFVAVALDMTQREKSAQIIKKQQIQAEELELSSKYKSEFLANMSHELRTPLNSINLLSKLLMDNRFDNLNEEQIEYLSVIQKSGNKLLELINDVLDLSKIEAGEISFHVDIVSINDIFKNLVTSFEAIAEDKGLQFIRNLEIDSNFVINTDQLRLEQVLANFLSNAFKFTLEGSVELTAFIPDKSVKRRLRINNDNLIAFCVKDTGIGIEKKKREMIFEAFQQADSSNKRSFGGSGLGLSISKEIAELLGGEIKLKSRVNNGSEFTLFIPVDSSLFIENNNSFRSGDKKAVNVNREIQSRLRQRSSENDKKRAKNNHTDLRILLVDDSDIHVSALKELLENDHIICLIANSAKETFDILKTSPIDLIILDLGLPDADGLDVINKLKSNSQYDHISIIVYSGRDLPDSLKVQYNDVVDRFITKTSGSYQELQDHIKRFLITDTDPSLKTDNQIDFTFLAGKNILIVDDDQRNIYSLTKALEAYQMNIKTAKNGEEALQIMHENNNFNAVLMDMMMPVMNGYDAMKKIRKVPAWENLPIIAITAKAMPDDKKRCIDSGASDYMSKPIDIENLIQTLYIWLSASVHINNS